MALSRWTLVSAGLVTASVALVIAQPHQAAAPPASAQGAAGQTSGGQQTPAAAAPETDPVRVLVSQLELEKYKATIKGLTQFGDRREGTQRNRNAVDWIEAQLRSYGCAPERMTYEPPQRGGGGGGRGQGQAGAATGAAARGAAATGAAAAGAGTQQTAGRGQGRQGQQAQQTQGQQQAQQGQRGQDPQTQGQQGRGGQGGGQGGGRGGNQTQMNGLTGGPGRQTGRGSGGSTIFGFRGRTGVNNSAANQPDERLRELNSGPVIPGPVPQVYCTKIGATRPNEMYIIGAHMDGIGYGEAANDDGSGTALVMELARILNAPGVTTDVSIRFALWNGEEGGLRGANAYVAQRRALQGQETPAGSGRYPEPKWLGMIQHDMMMWDHGMPRQDGTVSREQRPEADVNVEFQSNSELADASAKLAWFFKAANERYATDYPAAVGPHMTNTDSTPFMNITPSISLRENERGAQTGGGWNPHWHQVTDMFHTFYDKDFLLGLNAAQTTLAALAQLAGAKVK